VRCSSAEHAHRSIDRAQGDPLAIDIEQTVEFMSRDVILREKCVEDPLPRDAPLTRRTSQRRTKSDDLFLDSPARLNGWRTLSGTSI
jgi:hypothetical protein